MTAHIKKTLVITGSYPPDICGVGDYTRRLMQTDAGKQWTLYHSADWGIFSIFRHIRNVFASGADAIFMQYPTRGYGWSLVPHILIAFFSLFTAKRTVVNLHEYSRQTGKFRIAANLMLGFADMVIFTNDYERNIAARKIGRLKNRSKTVKIYSNIDSASRIREPEERSIDVVYFGHIRPDKGVETYVEIIGELRKETVGLNVYMAGQIPSGFEKYGETVLRECRRSGINVLLNLSGEEAADCLNDAKTACFPFPDGVSERRGSFLAAVKNGAAVVTTGGRFVTEAIARSFVLSDTVSEAAMLIGQLLADTDKLKERQRLGFEFLEREFPRSWDEVANNINRCILSA
jgi:glycosyltransferase involved in cell wall biosynthesis